MSTHNIQFHENLRKFPEMFVSWSFRKISSGIENGLELAMVNESSVFELLNHLSLASHKRDIGKQYRPRPDAAERGV